MAVDNDPVDAAHLMETEGWRNLTAMLEASGERPLKRPWHVEPDEEASSFDPGTPSEQLTKRFKQAASISP